MLFLFSKEMWDDEDYEPAPFDSGKVTDKWDGEDEDVSLSVLLISE